MPSSTCPVCYQLFPLSELERHANDHFAEEELEKDLVLAHQIAFSLDTETNDANYSEHFLGDTLGNIIAGGASGSRNENIHEKISSLSCLQIRSTFHKVEGGLMSLLRRCLELEGGNSISILVDHVDHFQSQESRDAGWGCGWRNIQMLSSHLLMQRPEAKEVLFGGSGFVPDIPSLQRWLEIAWERDFDVSGSDSFDKKVYGKTKWIGTTECAALLRSFGVRARVVDFGYKDIDTKRGEKSAGAAHGNRVESTNNPGSFNQSTPGKVAGHQILMEWVWNYFADKKVDIVENRRDVIVSEKTPLYFQHDGHSRTIVGIQVRQQSGMPKLYTLLVLDPGHRTNALESSLRENVGWQKLIKRGVHTLKKPQYQLCYVDPGIAHGEELEQLKTMDSIFFEF